ncbi:MAG: hypothetical protein AB1Z66_11935, partial [Candidatus Limnocylindrales bacterium]
MPSREHKTTVFLAWLAGSAAIAAAPVEPAPVTFVTGTVAEVYGYNEGDLDGTEALALGEPDLVSYDLRGHEVTTESGFVREVVEWSDPRLPADLWMTARYTLIWKGEDPNTLDGAINLAWRLLLQDEVGSWRGTGRKLNDGNERHGLYTLTGEGAYAGLSAVLHEVIPADAYGPWPRGFEG